MQQVRSRHRSLEQLPQTVLFTPSKQRRRRKKQSISFSRIMDVLRQYGTMFAFLGATFSMILLLQLKSFSARKRALGDATTISPINILFPILLKSTNFHKPSTIIDMPRSPIFGDVRPNLFTNDGMDKLRRIYRNIEEERGVSIDSKYPKSERSFFDYIYNFDDDYLRNPLWTWDDDKIQDEKTCRRNSWHRRSPMDCNSIHELDFLGLIAEEKMKVLGKGGFRDVFLISSGDHKNYEEVVFKQYHFDASYIHEDYEYMRIDSLVTEMFTSNPLFLDIYSNCGLSTVVQAMGDGCVEDYALPLQRERGYIKLNDEEDVDPKNNLTVTQKVNFALEMAESLAMMHNFPGGVIVHDDIHLEQFLLTKDHQHVKIQDFNRAEIMLWNSEDHEYCGYRNGPGHGEWRSPEEYRDWPLDEKIDVWSLGTNMYAMLTGLLPFYDMKSSNAVKKKIKEGHTPYIDPRYRRRSFGEQKLVEAIEKCWVVDKNLRSDIYDIVEILREAAKDPNGASKTEDTH